MTTSHDNSVISNENRLIWTRTHARRANEMFDQQMQSISVLKITTEWVEEWSRTRKKNARSLKRQRKMMKKNWRKMKKSNERQKKKKEKSEMEAPDLIDKWNEAFVLKINFSVQTNNSSLHRFRISIFFFFFFWILNFIWFRLRQMCLYMHWFIRAIFIVNIFNFFFCCCCWFHEHVNASALVACHFGPLNWQSFRICIVDCLNVSIRKSNRWKTINCVLNRLWQKLKVKKRTIEPTLSVSRFISIIFWACEKKKNARRPEALKWEKVDWKQTENCEHKNCNA